jgi:hypothetical protein
MSSEKFVEKRQIHHPRSLIILNRVPKRKMQKLQTWLNSDDRIDICPCHSSGEIVLINQTRRPRDRPVDPAEHERIRLALERYHAETSQENPPVPLAAT